MKNWKKQKQTNTYPQGKQIIIQRGNTRRMLITEYTEKNEKMNTLKKINIQKMLITEYAEKKLKNIKIFCLRCSKLPMLRTNIRTTR